jgi:hypothetical protein
VRWIVPGPVDEPGFFFGVRSARRADDKRSKQIRLSTELPGANLTILCGF